MRSYEERRDERHEYKMDVAYDVWRSGGNPDNVDADRCRDYYDAGYYHDEAARMEMQRQQPRHEEPDYCDYGMEQHYEGGW